MAHMYVAFLLELYQPPTQTYPLLDDVIKDCYVPLSRLFNCDLTPRFTISITHSLMSLLDKFGRLDEIIEGLKQAMRDDKIEVIHSGAFHPIFPLMPKGEVLRQIELDIELKEKSLGPMPKGGIISPELCYHDNLISFFKNMQFSWTVINDKVMEMNGVAVPEGEIYHIDGFSIFMRSSFWSDKITTRRENGMYWTGKEFVQHLGEEIASKDHDCYKILTLPGETFGYHIKYYQETFLRDMLYALQECESVSLVLVSDLLKIPTLSSIEKHSEQDKHYSYFPPSSIATEITDLMRGDRYPHWRSNGNRVHEKQWALTNVIFEACRKVEFESSRHAVLRDLLDHVFYSGQYFSASVWYWDPGSIYKGVDLQMRALYKYSAVTGDRGTLEKGQRLYTELMWEISKQDQVIKRGQAALNRAVLP